MKSIMKQFLILSTCCLCTIPTAVCMDDSKCMSSEKDVDKLIRESKIINSGSSAVLYQHSDYHGKVIKHYSGRKLLKGKGSEDEVASKLIGETPRSLMKCFEVLDENTIIYERIDGKTLNNWLFDGTDDTKIPFDIFCKDWVISMFEGMQHFYKNVSFPITICKKDKILYHKDNEPHLPCDMTGINIMVRQPDKYSRYPTPVRIDYGSVIWGNSDVLMRLADMLSYVMRCRVEYSKDQKLKFDKLFEFLKFSDDYRNKLAYDTENAEDYWFNPNLLLVELKKIIC